MKTKKLLYSIGQSTLEYALLIAVIAAALITMQVYIKRGIQGRVRDMADQISPNQYERGTTKSEYTTTQSGTSVQTYKDGLSRNEIIGEEETKRSGYEETSPQEQ